MGIPPSEIKVTLSVNLIEWYTCINLNIMFKPQFVFTNRKPKASIKRHSPEFIVFQSVTWIQSKERSLNKASSMISGFFFSFENRSLVKITLFFNVTCVPGGILDAAVKNDKNSKSGFLSLPSCSQRSSDFISCILNFILIYWGSKNHLKSELYYYKEQVDLGLLCDPYQRITS